MSAAPEEGLGPGGADDGLLPPARVAAGHRLQLNPQALRVVPAAHRKAWEELGRQVQIDVAGRFRKKWSDAETLRVIVADPDETYPDVAEELDRSPGGVRYRRQAMVHLLREEHGARERAEAYREDPKANHKHHDYYQVDEVLRSYGFYARPVSEQFAMAKPLRQPNSSWRGDGTGSVLATGNRELRELLRNMLAEARRPPGQDAEPGAGSG